MEVGQTKEEVLVLVGVLATLLEERILLLLLVTEHTFHLLLDGSRWLESKLDRFFKDASREANGWHTCHPYSELGIEFCSFHFEDLLFKDW